MPQMEFGRERFYLFHQTVHQFLRAANRNSRDVIDGFVRIEFGTLAADVHQRVHDLRLDVQQAEFKNLEQAAGARTDDYYVCFDCHNVTVRNFFGVSGIEASNELLNELIC